MTTQFELSDDTPVYVISIAAQLSGLHPQTLRAYDRLGLVSPDRTPGRGRRYSFRDILMLREVQRLSQEDGVNLSGVKRILELENAQQRSRMLLAEMHAEISQLRAELESTRAVAARLAGLLRARPDGAALVPVRDAATVSRSPAGGARQHGTPTDAPAAQPGAGAGASPATAAAVQSPAGSRTAINENNPDSRRLT
jgi:MerR family transcriptional regulator/heat shock protein HspR